MDPRQIKIFQWNCHSIHNKKGQLTNICHEYDVLILIESWLKAGSAFTLKNFNIIRKDRTSQAGGGICICIKKNIKFSIEKYILPDINQLESLTVNLYFQSSNLLIIAVYRPPTACINSSHWCSFFNSLSNFSSIYVGSDFNCHNVAWGSHYNCPNGDLLLPAIINSDLTILNSGAKTFVNTVSHSAIDISLISASLLPYSRWYTFDDSLSSDHLPVITTVQMQPSPIYLPGSRKLNLSKLDKKKFVSHLKDTDLTNSSADSCNDPVNSYKDLVASLNRALSNSLPPQPLKPFGNARPFPAPAPWWDDSCNDLVAKRKTSLKNFLTSSSMQNFIEYKKINAFTKRELKKIKRKKFMAFTESLNRNSPQSYVWETVKKFKSRFSPRTCIQSENTHVQAHVFKFIDSVCPQSCCPPFSITYPPSYSPVRSLMDPLSFPELKTAISSTKCKSSPGLDGFNYELIKILPDNFLRRFLAIVNDLLNSHKIPEDWKKFAVILLPKDHPNKFRPISLASCFLKITEKMICNRLTYFLENNNLLSPCQYGFRKGKSCSDCLSIISSHIYNAFASNGFLVCLFLDIRAAFDMVDPSILLQLLIELGIPESILAFIFNLMTNRELFFKFLGKLSGPFLTHLGVPQGCILSPLLFNIYTRKLHKHIDGNSLMTQFADDTTIFSGNKSLEACINSIQSSIDSLIPYLQKIGLEISPTKTKLVIFTSKRCNLAGVSVKILDSVIHPSSSVKYLGMILDQKLSWGPHINYISAKAVRSLNVIKCLRSTWWGSHPAILLNIYKALVRSILDYNSFLIATNNYKLFTLLNRIQYRAIRLCLGYRNSTPINVMLAEANELSLKSRFRCLAGKFITKVYSSSSHPLIGLLYNLNYLLRRRNSHNLNSSCPLIAVFNEISTKFKHVFNSDPPLPFLYAHEIIHFKAEASTELGTEISRCCNHYAKFLELFSLSFQNNTIFYTDGSKTNSYTYGGLAIYSPSLNRCFKFKLSSFATVFSLEALAILFSVRLIVTMKIKSSLIFSDSQAVILSLGAPSLKSSNYLILEIKKYLWLATQAQLRIRIEWIPGHKGIHGNSMADTLANEARSTGRLLNSPLPHTDLGAYYAEVTRERFYTSLKNIGANKGSYYFNQFFKSNTKPWFNKFSASRFHIVSLNRLRSNHYSLPASLFRKNLTNNSLCNCGIPSDLEHVLWECPLYSKQRSSLKRNLMKYGHSFPLDSVLFLKNPTSNIASLLTEFLKRSSIQL